MIPMLAHTALHQLNWGGQVPDQYYMTNTLKDKEDLKQTNVKSGATLDVDVEVDVIGTTIRSGSIQCNAKL